MSTLAELTCLSLRRPRPAASAVEVAEFYDAMASVHEHLAAEACGAEAVSERVLAASAQHRAGCLRSIPEHER